MSNFEKLELEFNVWKHIFIVFDQGRNLKRENKCFFFNSSKKCPGTPIFLKFQIAKQKN